MAAWKETSIVELYCSYMYTKANKHKWAKFNYIVIKSSFSELGITLGTLSVSVQTLLDTCLAINKAILNYQRGDTYK